MQNHSFETGNLIAIKISVESSYPSIIVQITNDLRKTYLYTAWKYERNHPIWSQEIGGSLISNSIYLYDQKQ